MCSTYGCQHGYSLMKTTCQLRKPILDRLHISCNYASIRSSIFSAIGLAYLKS